MTVNPENAAARRIVEEVRVAFPIEALKVDEALEKCGYEGAHIWIEYFSQLTTDAIKRGDDAAATAHLNIFSRLLARGDNATRRCIDVTYVEALMWDIKDERVKKNGWRLVPPNLSALYVKLWGIRPFMKGVK